MPSLYLLYTVIFLYFTVKDFMIYIGEELKINKLYFAAVFFPSLSARDLYGLAAL